MILDQLKKRWSLVTRCYVCESEVESIDLILLHCFKVKEL